MEVETSPEYVNTDPKDKSMDSCTEETALTMADIQEAPLGNGEFKRQRRPSQRRRVMECCCCPVCGVTVRLAELRNHFAQEVDRLATVSKNLRKPRREETNSKQSFQLVKINRENRIIAKMARYKLRMRNEVQCPVCNLEVYGDQEDVDRHVVQCLQQIEDEDEELVVDEDESFEEYEFADQTRTRAVSLVEGGHRGLPGDRVTHTREDEDLNVDVDDTVAYGKPQYSELDVVPSATSELEDQESTEKALRLRKAVLMDPTVQPQVLESRKWSSSDEKLPDSILSDIIAINSQSDHVVTCLKEKIKDLEQNGSAKCLICMDSYTKPAVSTTCWHVYCEECWLMTMGVKKLCPQCNMIVFPSDLRRIYL